MYQMTFTDFGNVSIMVGDSKNKTCAGSYIYDPDENRVTAVARWIGDAEQGVLHTYSHLLPDEKDQIADFLDKKKN